MNVRDSRSERGQVLIIVAMGFFLVLLAASALAIDIGNGLLQRRQLQNTADAAALAAATEISRGGSVSDAVTRAQAYVAANTAGVTLPYDPLVTLGVNLQNGIEIGNGVVRVALQRNVSTYFAGVLGVNHMNVGARARAFVGPYGVLPITFKRFSDGNTAYALTPPQNPETVTDYMMPAQNSLGQPYSIDNWPDPLTAPASPSASDTADGHYDPKVSGVIAPLIGHDAVANVANGNDFHFFVAPDVRNLSAVAPTFYNGAALTDTSSANLLKNTTLGYILAGGYPGPYPAVGDELAAFSGVTNNDAVHAMQERFKVGDVVAAMVYNGTVYRKPSFDLAVTPAVQSTDNTPTTTLTYTVTLTPVNNFNHPGVQFSVTGLSGWGHWSFNGAADDTAVTEAVTSTSPVTLTLTITADQPGARTALIEAYATPPVGSSQGQTRTTCATAVVAGTPSFSVSTAEGYKVVEQGSGTRFDLDVIGWNGISTENAVLDIPSVPGINLSYPSTVQVRDGHTNNLRINVDVPAGTATGEYTIPVTVKDADSGHQERNQTILLSLEVTSSAISSTVLLNTSFVKVLGYASFRIDNFTNNTVYAHVVGPIVPSPDLLGKGMPARLVPWN